MSPFSTTTTFLQIPTAYPAKQHLTKQSNLHHFYFTPLTHILLYIISRYTLHITSLELPRGAKGDPQGTIPTGALFSYPVSPPGLTPIKILSYALYISRKTRKNIVDNIMS